MIETVPSPTPRKPVLGGTCVHSSQIARSVVLKTKIGTYLTRNSRQYVPGGVETTGNSWSRFLLGSFSISNSRLTVLNLRAICCNRRAFRFHAQCYENVE